VRWVNGILNFQAGCRGFGSRLPLQLQIQGISEQDLFDF
jgi:hypothetical protein